MAATCWSDVQADGTKDKRRTVAKHTGKDAGSGDVQKYLQNPFRRGRGAAKRRRKKDRKKMNTTSGRVAQSRVLNRKAHTKAGEAEPDNCWRTWTSKDKVSMPGFLESSGLLKER